MVASKTDNYLAKIEKVDKEIEKAQDTIAKQKEWITKKQAEKEKLHALFLTELLIEKNMTAAELAELLGDEPIKDEVQDEEGI